MIETSPSPKALRRRSRRRGITLIETLISSLIVTISMTGTMAMFFAVSNMSNRTSQATVAAAIARRRIEEVRYMGFQNQPEGTSVQYFDMTGSGGAGVRSLGEFFSATTVVSSTALSGTTPTKTALRTVTVTVRRVSDNAVLESTGTYLAWGGI
ncbi:type II secretion system protein [bacterium]|nr:MAG: type II secretion system protein [bacterium]